MSGGSYNYLCFADEQIFTREYDLQQMADRIARLGYAEDARETMRRRFFQSPHLNEVLSQLFDDIEVIEIVKPKLNPKPLPENDHTTTKPH